MPDTKISALPAVVTPTDADEFAVNQAGASKKLTLAQIKAQSEASGAVASHAGAADPHTVYLKESVVSGFASPSVVLGTAAAAGSATTGVRTDATIVAFDATAPTTQAFGDAAAVGTATVASRRDHKHAMMAAPAAERAASSSTPAAVGTAAVGTGTTDARADHVHATGAGTPSTQAFGDSAATGTGPAAAMTDHKHAMPPAPLDLFIGPYDPRLAKSPLVVGAANKAYFAAFQVSRAVTVTKAEIRVGGTSAGNIDLGIYNDSGTRLGSTGSTAAASAYVVQQISLTAGVALVPGTRYWAAISASDATMTMFTMYDWGGWTGNVRQFAEVASSFPLPAGPVTYATGAILTFAIEFLA